MDPSYNNPFAGAGTSGNFGVAPTPQMSMTQDVSTGRGGGDIILGPEKKKRSKRLLTVCGVAAVIVAAIIVIINSFSRTEPLDLAFNKIANYVLFGDDSSDEIMLKDTEITDKILREKFNEKDTEYAEELKGRVEDFKVIFEKEKNNFNNSAAAQIDSYLEGVDFLVNIMELANYNDTTLLDLFDEDGFEKAENKIDDNYVLQESDSEDIKEYVELRKEYAKTYLRVLNYYDSIKCLKNKTINMDCVLSNPPKAEIDDFYNKLEDLKNEIQNIENYALNKVVYDILTIIDSVKNEAKNEQK